MKKGHLLYIDEINMAKPETLPILNGVLDYRRMITNPFTGEIVKAANDFTVIAAINEGYVGTVPLNEALKNRFIVIEVPYIQGDILKQVLLEQSGLKDEVLINRFVTFSADLISQVKNGQISEEAASIRALLDTCDLSGFMPALRAIQRGIIEKLDDDREKAAIRNIAETLFE
jgi:MoxR-like ATPase